jgi:hypothetical protein
MPDAPARDAIAWLRTPEAVRERCHALLELAEADRLVHFALDLGRLDDVAGHVAGVIRSNYPRLVVPYHARWRHFETGGIDRWGMLAARLGGCDGAELARTRIDLCTVSVLLDAGAGPGWRFQEPETGQVLSRSEGLAVASLHAFGAGVFSSDPERPCRVDGVGLSRLSAATLGAALQVSADNPLVGLQGRVALLRNLGGTLRSRPEFFGADGRMGALFDRWRALAGGGGGGVDSRFRGNDQEAGGNDQGGDGRGDGDSGALSARSVLTTLLDALAPIWPGRLRLGDENLGDVWRHPMLHDARPGGGLVPLHKLSQWLVYSLMEVLEQAGIRISGLDALTGLAEYRNGGLFVDLGVLTPRDPELARAPLAVDDPAVVEWRGLTVALLDRLAPLVRARIGVSVAALPLARLLQGGTWDAGRRIARERRADGGPPLRVVSDGTVF